MTTAPVNPEPATAGAHFWQGSFIDDEEAARRLAELPELAARVLAEPLSTELVLTACQHLADALAAPAGPVRTRLLGVLTDGGTDPEEAAATLAEIADAIARPSLERKLRRELGALRPERLARPDARETTFEAWAPVGLLVHIAPGNAAAVAPLSTVEGLLTGNLNVLKTSSADTPLAQHLLAELAAADPTGALARRIVALRFPSARTDWLRQICGAADAVAVWGGEDAVRSVSELVPAGCRLIEWGHRISFAYLTRDAWSDRATLDALAADVCRYEQQACSSPQVVYLDTEDDGEVFAFAERFAAHLAEASAVVPRPALEPAEHAEITTTELVARLEEHLGLTRVLAAEDGSWRVLADTRPALAASPLHRSVWVKPLPRTSVMAVLRPMRRYLQTAAIGGSRADVARLSQAVLAAGVLRVTPVGGMLDGYHGEPHDGVYALQRYSRRVSVRAGEAFATTACLDDLAAPAFVPAAPGGPLLDKAGVQEQLRTLAPDHAQLYFRSGGSTGAPALSVFTNADYDTQMRAAADGLLAAGFDPARDRAANLFYCGGMYGSFISFFSILERLNATQLPIAAGPDHAATAEALVTNGADTVFGMPSYLWQLFHAERTALRAYGGIRKVFYGGEHFTAEQRRVLTEEFGVELIRSAAYGSTDLGPLGYQCAHAEGSVHHVLTDLHTLEVLAPEADRPVAAGQPGRLVFTSRARAGQRLERYQIGDLGRTVDGVCPCGSHTPRIELLGRYGDVVRVGTYFLNVRRFVAVAQQELGYRGEVQLVLETGERRERAVVRLDAQYAQDGTAARAAFLTAVAELGSAVEEGLLDLAVETVDSAAFERTPTSGKLRTVIDRRRTAG
ncbi:phenylacetate-coenzyme A ligase PaaK-like adenylate-forming protein [Streptomyces sp. 1114.5]|uniref:acyl-CoA reductase n=1 Tax=Streptomyces sp. 1114.5 TaxID=1938830 RepID=UPI000F2D5C8E|nr:acyl-CoA reductase [Streptomyces sp. 1114.5]RKT12230.1 phenylacetate-coenzyme A ligase PaaK-like adenylate-forming protein [Streptomyces sp. 1114.5]